MAELVTIALLGKSKDITGKTFGRLTAVRPVRRAERAGIIWECLCDCGTVTLVNNRDLLCGDSKSCGCLRREKTGERFRGVSLASLHKWKVNGLRVAFPAEYSARQAAISRCTKPSDKDYKRYGGRGIFVCDRWMFGENGMSGVECFILDMGPRPEPSLSLDRINNSGPYSPDNCRWTDRITQANNKG